MNICREEYMQIEAYLQSVILSEAAFFVFLKGLFQEFFYVKN